MNHVLVFRHSISDDNHTTPFNLAELVTASQTMKTITEFLKSTIQLIESDCGGETFSPMFHEIVTDKSFANIGAILRAFNDMTLTEYLDVCWKILNDRKGARSNEGILNKLVAVRLCSSHTCKTMNDLICKHFKGKDMVKTICQLIGPLFNIADLESALRYAETLLFTLTSKKRGENFAIHAAEGRKLLKQCKMDYDDDDDTQLFVDQGGPEEDEEAEEMDQIDLVQHHAIYKNSKCYQRLNEFLGKCKYDDFGDYNKYYVPNFAKEFLKNHLSYLILWGRMMTYQRNQTVPRANNGPIENYFRQLKDVFREESRSIGMFGFVRCGIYIKTCSELIDSKVKAINFNIPSRRLKRHCSSTTSSSSSQRSKSSQDLTEADVTQAREGYGKRNSRSQTKKSSKFFNGRRSSSLG